MIATLLSALALAAGAGGILDLEVTPLGPPAAAGASLHPHPVAGADGSTWACWTERDGKKSTLRAARLEGARWLEPVTVAAGKGWFVNWADFPSMAVTSKGVLAAHWLERLGEGTYAYGVRVRCSDDGAKTWGEPFWLHDDRSASEHGFASLVPVGPDRFAAVWLDGRSMIGGGSMTLRARGFDASGKRSPEQVLDGRVCECCCTALSGAGEGLVVLYRDRSADDVRDIGVVRLTGDGETWSRPARLHDDGWRMPG